jgi:hypothetical protein
VSEPGSIYGYLAEFGDGEALLRAARKIHGAGYQAIDAYSPTPIVGLSEALGFRCAKLPFLVLLGALVGGGGFYFLEYFLAVVNYPHNIGGRPVFSWPAFIFPAVEMTILFAALFGVIGMLALNRLPRLRHPLFGVPAFDLASQSRFFLCVRQTDPKFDPGDTRSLIESLDPVGIYEVER